MPINSGVGRIPSPVGAGSIKAQARAVGSTPITIPRANPAGRISDPPQSPSGNNFIREIAAGANSSKRLSQIAQTALRLKRRPVQPKRSVLRRLDGDL